MKKRMVRFCCGVMAAGLLISGIPSGGAEGVTRNHLLWNVAAAAETAVTVSNENEFLSALAQKQKNIVVTGSFSVTGKTETNGQMIPIEIPGATVITGNNVGDITFRGPIQIMGDGVVIRDIQIGFISTNSINSVPHREIFLAGHSLTLDNVKTYLPGGGDANLGDFVGTEKELLPTIYAGGYHSNTAVGTKASLTVVNANSETMFQNIYMGHKASAGERTAYMGSMELNLDADAKVRDVISAEETTSASLVFSGEQNGTDEISISEIKGNANTVLTVKNCAVTNIVTTGIENIVLDEGGRLQPKDQTAQLNNITLKNGGCLDFTQVIDAVVNGNFTGGDSVAKGKIVLDKGGYVQIKGQVRGVTQFQVGSHAIPGNLLNEHTYIIAENSVAGNFVLSETDINNNYGLKLADGAWTTCKEEDEEEREPYEVSVNYFPSEADFKDIPFDITKKTEKSPYLELVWSDRYDDKFTPEEALQGGFYKNLIVIRSDYWNSTDGEDQKKTDWGNSIRLENDGVNLERYYLIASDKSAKPGTYMLLLCSRAVTGLSTVGDVKKLLNEDVILNSGDYGNAIEITFTGKPEENVPVTPEPNPDPEPDTEEPAPHEHTAGRPVTENRVEAQVGVEGSYDKVVYCTTCHKELSREKVMIPALKEPDKEQPTETPAEKPTETPTEQPTETPTETPTEKPTETPTETPTEKPTETPTETPAEKPTETPTETPAHNHSYVLQKTVEATCLEEGEKVFSCTCGDSYTEKIAKKSHTPEKKLTPAKPGSNGKSVTMCSVCKTVLKQDTIYAPKTIKLAKDQYIYDGKAKKPGVKVTDNKGKVISGSSYKISYQDHKNVGKATVTVKFQGNYTGTLKKTFEICPKGTSLTDVKAGKKSFSVRWKKQASQTSGYEIAYATDASFSKKNTKTAVIKSNKTISKEIKGLKPGKKYYVKVRTYKEVKSGSKKVKIYSGWSKSKTVKTKK